MICSFDSRFPCNELSCLEWCIRIRREARIARESERRRKPAYTRFCKKIQEAKADGKN